MARHMSSTSTAGDFHRDWNERRWSQSSCSSMKSYMETAYPHTAQPIHRHGRRHSKQVDYDDSPTITEITLPWRRDGVNTGAHNPSNNHSNFPSGLGRFSTITFSFSKLLGNTIIFCSSSFLLTICFSRVFFLFFLLYSH